jgi:hypothetical protein
VIAGLGDAIGVEEQLVTFTEGQPLETRDFAGEGTQTERRSRMGQLDGQDVGNGSVHRRAAAFDEEDVASGAVMAATLSPPCSVSVIAAPPAQGRSPLLALVRVVRGRRRVSPCRADAAGQLLDRDTGKGSDIAPLCDIRNRSINGISSSTTDPATHIAVDEYATGRDLQHSCSHAHSEIANFPSTSFMQEGPL